MRSKSKEQRLSTYETESSKIKCVVCNQIKKDQKVFKARISTKEFAERFLKVARDRQGNVSKRLGHIISAEELTKSNVYYHSNCMKCYLKQRSSKVPKIQVDDENIEIDLDQENNDKNLTENFCIQEYPYWKPA